MDTQIDNKDKPIYPLQHEGFASKQCANVIDADTLHGLTKREYFAGLAMQGWISCQQPGFTGEPYSIAQRSIECADELLKQLEHEK